MYETTYWKQHCFGLTAGTVLDKAVELRSIGGSVGPTRKPSRFVCLTLKLLQIQPDPDVVLEYVKQDTHKYVRLLGAFYWRLTARPADVFRYLEPLLADARRVRVRHPDGTYALSYVDEVVDSLLVGETLFDVALPRLPPRRSLVATGALAPRVSPLAAEFEAMQATERAEAEAAEERGRAASVRAVEDGELPSASLPPPPRRRSRSPGERRRSRSPRDRQRSRSPGERPRSRSPRRREKWQLSRSDRERGVYGGGDDRYDRRGRRSPPRRRSRSGSPKRAKGGKEGDGLSIDETNRLRASLGLPPLK